MFRLFWERDKEQVQYGLIVKLIIIFTDVEERRNEREEFSFYPSNKLDTGAYALVDLYNKWMRNEYKREYGSMDIKRNIKKIYKQIEDY